MICANGGGPMASKQVLLGLDGGGTHTRCLVAELSGKVLSEGRGGPSNYMSVGRERAGEGLRAAISSALEAAGRSAGDVAAACLGLAGAGRPEDQAVIRSLLTFLEPAPIQIVSDGRIALAGAFDGGPGVIVIAGTGSSVFGLGPTGELLRAGGWGWLLGDEGSGYFLGRSALAAALSAQDETGPPTELGSRICRAWSIDRLEQALQRVYGDLHAAKAELAALAPVVFEAAAAGDLVAGGLLAQAGRDLAVQAASVLRRLGMTAMDERGNPPGVALTGGVLSPGSQVALAFERNLAQQVPAARVVDCLGSPAEGAVRLALTLLHGG